MRVRKLILKDCMPWFNNRKQAEVEGRKSIQKVRMICNFFLSSAELRMVTFLFASYMLTTACGTVRPGICVKYFLSFSQKNLSPEKTETI